MGGILVSMLVAHSRLVRQSNRALLVREASTLADDLLAEWFVSDSIPVAGAGEFASAPGFQWQTSTLRVARGQSDRASVIRFQIHGDNRGELQLLFDTELLVESIRDER
jgi:hypothetical protein